MIAAPSARRRQEPPPAPPGAVPVPGFPGYLISRDDRTRGTVWYVPHALELRTAWQPLGDHSRPGRRVRFVHLWRDGQCRERSVPALVRLAFTPFDPSGPLGLGPSVRGEAHPKAKLSESQVREIRALRASDCKRWTERALAARFAVCAATIHFALCGTTWRHIIDDTDM